MRDKFFRFLDMLAIFIIIAICLSVVCHGSCSLPAEILYDDWRWMYISFAVSMPILSVIIFQCPKEFARIISVLTPWVFIVYGGILSIWGIMQIYGYTYSNHSMYSLTGPFYNPGPYSGYIAMILPICVNEWLKQKKISRNFLYYFSLTIMLFIMCLLPASMSRSAWIATFSSCIYVILMNYMDYIEIIVKKYRKRIIPFAIISIIIILLFLSGLYLLKKDSADGRLLMWKISFYAILENPWIGTGWNSVPSVYGQAQENYFAKGNYTSSEEVVAGSPEYVFNEYLQVAIAWGIPAACLILLVVVVGFYIGNKKRMYGICGALISLSIFSFSSYPLQFPSFVSALAVLVFACYVQLIEGKRLSLRFLSAILLIGLSFLCTMKYKKECKTIAACKRWMECRVLYNSGAYIQVADNYAEIKDELKYNARFMFEYGHALHKLHRSEMSNKILSETLQISGDPMILNIMGKNEQEMKRYDMAEHYFLRSVHRLPSRIYPYYLLANLYFISEYYNHDKFYWASDIVLNKEPKVHSTAIRQMREDIRKLIRVNDSSNLSLTP